MNNKYLKYACMVISLVFVFSAKPADGVVSQDVVQQSTSQEIEPELAKLLADNPDIADKLLKSKPGDSKQSDSVQSTSVKQDISKSVQVEPAQARPAQTESIQADISGQSDQIKELEPQLSAITDAFNSIFHDYLFLDQTTSLNQTELCSLKLYVENEIAYIKKMLEQSAGKALEINMCKCDIKMLCAVISCFKFACLHLEVLSVSADDSKLSALKEPLDFIEMQQAKLKILDALFELYKKREFNCSLPDMQARQSGIEFSEALVKSIILKSLPARLQSSGLAYILYASTRYLNKILNQNFYTKSIVLAEEYFEVVSTFYKAQNFDMAFDVASFLTKIDSVINAFAADLKAVKSNDCVLPLKLLLAKLIKIKNDAVKFYQPCLIFKDNQEKAKLFTRFKLLFVDKRLEAFCTDKQFYVLFDLYCNVFNAFFTDKFNPAEMAIKLFEVKCKIEKEISYRQGTSITEAVLSHWIDGKGILGKLALSYCKNSKNALLEEMENLLIDAITIVDNDLKSKSKGFFANIKDAIFSSKWIDSGKVKNMGIAGSQSAVDFLELVFDRKFENFKEAAFFLLARVSPVLAAGLIYKIMPHLSGNLKEKTSELLNSTGIDLSDETGLGIARTDKSGKPGADNKIFDFISKNPEIFNKLCEVKPELVNALADFVQRRLVEAKA